MVAQAGARSGGHKGLWLVLILGLALRLLYLFEYSQSAVWEQLTVDNWYHHHWAETIADGNLLGDTTYFRAPLYSICLGGLYSLFGASLWVGRLFGLVIGMASIVLTYLLTRRAVPNFGQAWLPAGIQALYPVMVYFELELLLDPLFTLLVQLAVHRFLIWLDSRRQRDVALTGLWFGLAAITRPTILVVAALVAIWIVVRSVRATIKGISTVGQLGLYLCVLAIVVFPVTVRNLYVASDPVLISSQGGINLYVGNNDAADGLSAVLPEPLGHNWTLRQVRQIAEDESGRRLKPGEVSAYWRDRAIDWGLSHPGRFLELYSSKLGYQFVDREVSNNRELRPHFASFTALRYDPLSFGVILPFALVGIFALWRGREEARFVASAMLMYILATALFFVNARFRLPLLPYYFMFAAAGLSWLVHTARNRPSRLLAPVVLAVAAGWFSFAPPMSYPAQRTTQYLMSRGSFLYNRNEFAKALSVFGRAAAIDATWPETNLSLGACFFRMGQADSAAFYFEKEINLHPQRSKAYYNLASLHLVNGRNAEALRLVDQALALAPYDVTANLIRLRAIASEPGTSAEELWQAVERSAAATEDDLSLLNEAAVLLSQHGCDKSVEECLRRAERATPPPIETDDFAFHGGSPHQRAAFQRERAKTYYLLGYCAGLGSEYEAAIRYSQTAVGLDPDLAEAYINLYSGYLSTGRLIEADSILSAAAARFPEHPRIRQLIGR